MTKTKIILVVLALSLVIMAAIGVVYAQSVNAQYQDGTYSQIPAQGYGGNYGCFPHGVGNGYGYTQYPQQGAYPFRMGMGMGMMGRFW